MEEISVSLAGGTRRCTRCGAVKALAEFYAHKRGAGGRRPDCKAYHNDYHNRGARRRYVPMTGRGYRTRCDRAAAPAAEEPDDAA